MKVIVLLKRKAGLTHEQFREHYETVHSKLADKYFGHLVLDYRRHYPHLREADRTNAPVPDFAYSPYDAITVIHYKDRDGFLEARRIMTQPDVLKIFEEDEDRFMDRASFRVFPCDDVASDLKS